MMMVEDIKKNFNNSLKEIQENTAKELQVLKEKQENTTKQVEVLIRKTGKHMQTGDENEQNHTRPKMGSGHNKENPKQGNARDRNHRKDVWNHRCQQEKQNTRDGRENLRCRGFHRKH